MVLNAVPDLVEERSAGVSLDGFKHGVDATQDDRLEKVVGVRSGALSTSLNHGGLAPSLYRILPDRLSMAATVRAATSGHLMWKCSFMVL